MFRKYSYNSFNAQPVALLKLAFRFLKYRNVKRSLCLKNESPNEWFVSMGCGDRRTDFRRDTQQIWTWFVAFAIETHPGSISACKTSRCSVFDRLLGDIGVQCTCFALAYARACASWFAADRDSQCGYPQPKRQNLVRRVRHARLRLSSRAKYRACLDAELHNKKRFRRRG